MVDNSDSPAILAPVSLSSIIVPHYRTPDRLDLCLRCLARFTPEPHEVIVVDNGSEPAVLEWLRKRDDLTLVERQQGAELGQRAHAEALDAGIFRARGDYIVTIHSDTFVRRPGWLSFLIERLEAGPYDIVAPGTQHIRPYSAWERLLRVVRGDKPLRRLGPVYSIYRRKVFDGARFAGHEKVWQIAEPYRVQGRANFLGREEASRWAFHSGGSTKLEILRHRRTAAYAKERQLRSFLRQPEIRDLLRAPGA